MIRRAAAVLVATIGLVLVLSGTAGAHPLGNFTTNSYQEVVASGDRVYVLSVLDLAEIPTFQAKPDVARLGRDDYSQGLAKRVRGSLELRVDGIRRPLAELKRSLFFPKGAAGLRTTRLEIVLDAGPLTGSAHRVDLRAAAFSSRVGWREIVVRAERGASLASPSVPSTSSSNRLLSYPEDQLQSPLDVREAMARVTPGDEPAVAPSFGENQTAAPSRTSDGGFAALVNNEELSVGVIAVSLLVAMFWGAAHALTPGHGKAIVAAYIAGTKGRPRDAFALGGIVTVTHTLGVFALGFVTLLLSSFIVPEDLYPWLNLVSAVLVVGVGASVFYARWKTKGWDHHHDHDDEHGHDHSHAHGHHHHHGHGHGHENDHGHSHAPEPGAGWRGLLAVGISGGLLPCPTALVVLLAAISLHRVAFGMILIVAFSVGLAAVVSAIGLLAIGARRTFARMSFQGPLIRVLPAVSALVIVVVGLAMTVRALPQVT